MNITEAQKMAVTVLHRVPIGPVVCTHGNFYVLANYPVRRALQGPDAVMASEQGGGDTGAVRRWGSRQDNQIQGGPARGRASGTTIGTPYHS